MPEVAKWHDPDAKLDYSFDWSGTSVLADADEIASATVTTTQAALDDGVELSTVTHTGSTVTVWVQGGSVRSRIPLRCHVVTVAGREDDATGVLVVRDL